METRRIPKQGHIDVLQTLTHVAVMSKSDKIDESDIAQLIREWKISPEATLGSSIRIKGILQEVRTHLPLPVRKLLDLEGASMRLVMPESAKAHFRATCAVVSERLAGIDGLPVIPREIQDILTITTTERHRWLKDGRLPSAGTRTVRLRGRAKQITFHVFDPRLVADLLDRGAVDDWREEDAIVAAEKKQHAAWNRKMARSPKTVQSTPTSSDGSEEALPLAGWEEFGRDGLLR